ncbi:hypothetical protein WHU47_19915 [Escherichia coli]
MKMVEASLKKMLFRFSPQEIQEAVKNDDYQLPVYTASLFRHNVGHSMAMSGASAPEIAYILGQSSYVVADRYIERINKQMLIGKTPKTLADLFFIEQKRIERNNNG